MIIHENVHTGNIMWIEKAVFRKSGVYMEGYGGRKENRKIS